MDCEYLAALQTSVHSRAPAAALVGVGGYKSSVVVVATPGVHRSNDICLWQPLSLSSKQLTLLGHSDSISALAFSPSPSPSLSSSSPSPSSPSFSPSPSTSPSPSAPTTLLCSASTDALLLWDVDDCYQCSASGANPQGRPLPAVHRGGPVSCVCFSTTARWVAVCVENETLVFLTESRSLDTTLVGHSAPVTCAAFSPHHSSTIVTASQDRTFKIWDLAKSSLVFQSSIISASPFLCVAIDPRQALLAVGAADGKLRVYDMSKNGVCQCLHELDTSRELEKLFRRSSPHGSDAATGPSVITRSSPWQQKQSVETVTQDTPTTLVEIGPAILDVYYWLTNSSIREANNGAKPLSVATRHSEEHISEVLREPPSLLVVTHMGLLRLRASTLELLEYLDFREPMFSADTGGGEQQLVPAVASCSFASKPDDQEELYCALGAMFHSTVSVLRLRAKDIISGSGEELQENAAVDQKAEQIVSVLSSAPLVPDSPLRAEFIPKAKPAATAKKKPGVKERTQKVVVDQPLTFKAKVRSSGYTENPRTKMFVPRSSTSRHKPSPAAGTKKSTADGSSVPRELEHYPVECQPTAHLSHTVQLSDRPAPINCASFSGSGQYLACASADKAAYLLKTPFSAGKTHMSTFVGHDGPVLSSSWSHDDHWLLTSSGDRSARLWAPGRQDPLLTLSSSLHNFREAAGARSNKASPAFPREITDARFYYLDKFLLLLCGNTLYLYKYHVDTAKPDDIKRYQSNSRYRLVKSFVMESAQSITAMSCINDFYSYLVFLAGSNKALEVYDMNVGRVARTVADVHTRPATCIAQNKGSRYTTHPPDAYDLFLTSAVTDGVKLWDLRTSRCLHRFTSHQNRSHHLSAAISPCARFIATGSEDKAAYIYELRSSSPLHRLTGHSDVVSTVTYHPLRPMLATCTISGQLRLYKDAIR